jgi:hypothetical protein
MKKQAKQPAPLTTDLPLILYPLWKEKEKEKQKQKQRRRRNTKTTRNYLKTLLDDYTHLPLL